MNLSLEIKRFMNNEHVGDYVSVVLPSELPVERSEVREVNRDKSAAHSARSLAENKARAAAKARDRVENTTRLRENKSRDLEEARSVLDEIVSQQQKMLPELEAKRAVYEAAAADYDEKRGLHEVKRESYTAAENSYNAAMEAERTATLVLNDCRANLSSAETALSSAKEDGTRHEGRLSTSMKEATESKVLAENARLIANETAKLESEKRAQYNELSDKTASLLAVMKSENKRLSDTQRNLSNAARDYNKAASDHSAAVEALKSAENNSADSDPKILALRSKVSAAEAKLNSAEIIKTQAEADETAAETASSNAAIEYNKMNELLSSCKAELDELSSRSAGASNRAAEAEASYTSVNSSFEKSKGDVESNVRDVRNLEAALVSSKKALLNAESDVAQRHEEVIKERASMDKARAELDAQYTAMKSAEAIYNSKKNTYDKINSEYQMAEKDRKTQRGICDRLSSELRQLESQLETETAVRDSAVAEADELEAEAERKRLSVRTINTKYETVKIHFIQQGKGEDLLLIHSVGQSLYTFRDLINKLSGKFRVTALDLVGFGYSEKPYYFGYTLDEMGDFIDHFMDAMGIEYAHLFGFSMGAGYVVDFAKRYPDKVGKVVLLSPGGITPDMPSSVRAIGSRLFGGIAARMLSYKSVKKMLGECFFDLTNHTDELCEEYYKPISLPDAKRVIRQCVACYDDEEVIHSLRDVAADTLILWGNEDKWHTTEMSELFRSVMPKVKYTLIRNAGHLSHEEKPDRVAQLIKQFIPCGYDEQEEETTFK